MKLGAFVYTEPEQTNRVAEFEQLVDQCIVDAVSAGADTFNSILLSLPSVYPAAVLHSLRRLAAERRIPTWIAKAAEISVGLDMQDAVPKRGQTATPDLPVPHPLDYEWRFTPETVRGILHEVVSLSSPGDVIALVGGPSIFYAACQMGEWSDRKFVLVDGNRHILKWFASQAHNWHSIVECNLLRAQPPALNAQVVVTDAPWYPTYLEVFLRAASHVCAESGSVIASIPPVGTRPGINRERGEMLGSVTDMQLRVEQVRPLVFNYLSPLFERNALHAEGIKNYPNDWRRGDMLVLTKPFGVTTPAWSFPISCEWEWWEEDAKGVRIRGRVRSETQRKERCFGFQDPTVVSLVPGDVLPSVSRRDERRLLADIWTSGNRIYACRDTQTLRVVLQALKAGASPVEQVSVAQRRTLTREEARLVARAAIQVADLIRVEQRDIQLYGN
jgi:hypothetical protein